MTASQSTRDEMFLDGLAMRFCLGSRLVLRHSQLSITATYIGDNHLIKKMVYFGTPLWKLQETTWLIVPVTLLPVAK